MYFDTHAHYDDEQFEPDRNELLETMPVHDVELILNAGTNVESSLAGLDMAQKYPFIYCAAGIHPHEADAAGIDALNRIEAMLGHPRILAVGEIGLDYHYDFSPRERQREIFRLQLDMAQRHDMPVIVHDREAHKDCLDITAEYPAVCGVFHCFSGSAEMARILVKRGWYISFAGPITFKNARQAIEAASEIPLDRILIETDSPYLSPEPKRGRRNDSRNLPFIVAAVAKIRRMTPEAVADLCLKNGKRLFGLT